MTDALDPNNAVRKLWGEVNNLREKVSDLESQNARLRLAAETTIANFMAASEQKYDELRWDEFCSLGAVDLLSAAIANSEKESA